MKILHIIPSLDQKFGGPSKALKDIVKYQKKAAIFPEVLTTFRKDEKKISLEVPVHSFNSYTSYRFSPKFKKWLKANIKNYDLVHIHTMFGYTTVIASKLSKKNNIPYIIRPCGMLMKHCLSSKSLKKNIYLAFYKKHFNTIMHFTSNKERERSKLCKHFLLPLGIDYEECQKKPGKYLLYLGRLHPIKGIEFLLKAVGNNKLIIAGDGNPSYVDRLKKLAPKNVKFIGYVYGEKKKKVLENATAFILPSYSENFGIAVVEAMSCKLPVLISENVALAEDIKKAKAGIVFPLQIEKIKEAIKNIQNKQLQQTLSNNAFNLVKEKFNWKIITEKQINIYKEIIKFN